MATNFRIDYYEVLSHANQLEAIADDIANQINKLNATYSEIDSNWDSDSSDMYLSKQLELKENVNSTRQKLISIANQIRVVAKRIQDEDQRQADLARSLANTI